MAQLMVDWTPGGNGIRELRIDAMEAVLVEVEGFLRRALSPPQHPADPAPHLKSAEDEQGWLLTLEVDPGIGYGQLCLHHDPPEQRFSLQTHYAPLLMSELKRASESQSGVGTSVTVTTLVLPSGPRTIYLLC